MDGKITIKNPCKRDCAERSPTCHAECEKYRTWVESRQPELKARAQRQTAESHYLDYVNARNERLRKFRRKIKK